MVQAMRHETGSPLSLPYASQLAADVEFQAVEWARQQQARGAQEQVASSQLPILGSCSGLIRLMRFAIEPEGVCRKCCNNLGPYNSLANISFENAVGGGQCLYHLPNALAALHAALYIRKF